MSKRHYVNISMLIELCHISVILSDILLILFINCIYKLLVLDKRKLSRVKIGYFSIIDKNIENKLMLCLSIPIPGFPHFYYILGANLGSLLHGDVSVMYRDRMVNRVDPDQTLHEPSDLGLYCLLILIFPNV